MKPGAEIARDWCGTLHRGEGRVVKVVTLENGAALAERARSAADATRRVAPPSVRVPRASDVEVERGTLRIAIEVADGMPLSDFLEKGHRLETKRLVVVVRALGEALADLHDAGVAHGDVTPENVLLHRGDSVTLLDFCVTRTTGETPTAAGDQRALAATVHRLLTGSPPSGAASTLAKQRPDLPGGVARAIAKALSPEPYDSTRAFARAFAGAFLDETALPQREPTFESGIWDVPRRERERAAADDLARPAAGPPASIASGPNGTRRVIALTLLGAILGTWWLLTRRPERSRRGRGR